MEHIDEFEELALGTLAVTRREAAEKHLRVCATCTEALKAVRGSLGAVAQSAGQLPSPDAARQRLEEWVKKEKYAHLVPQIARLFDLAPSKCNELVAQIDDASAWSPGPDQGIRLIAVDAGPAVANALTALVCIEPGATFPHHEHLGEERILVLQGGFRHSDGSEVWRGELDVQKRGSEHSFVALEGQPCICAAVNFFE